MKLYFKINKHIWQIQVIELSSLINKEELLGINVNYNFIKLNKMAI